MQKSRRMRNAGCDNIHLSETKLFASLERICIMGPKQADGKGAQCLDKQQGEMACLKTDRVVESTLELLEKVFLDGGTAKERERLENTLQETLSRKAFLLEKFLEGIVSDQDYKQKSGEMQEKINKLRQQSRRMEECAPSKDAVRERLNGIRKRLEEGVAVQAMLLQLTGAVEKIRVYPQKLEIIWANREIGKGEADAQCCSTSNRFSVEAEKEQILERLKRCPATTAKKVADETGMHLSRVQARIRMLKAEGKIRYSARNGRGEWIVIGMQS